MENVMREMIKEELEERSRKPKDEEENLPRKKCKTEGRLSSLLNKIRKKNDEGTNKTKRVQVKWKRYCLEKKEYKLVRASNGGGVRSLVIPTSRFTLGELMEKAISLFYAEDTTNCNSFGELREETVFQISNQAGDTLSNEKDLWIYLEENCLLPSKTTFILKSRTASDLFVGEENLLTVPPSMLGLAPLVDLTDLTNPFPESNMYDLPPAFHTSTEEPLTLEPEIQVQDQTPAVSVCVV